MRTRFTQLTLLIALGVISAFCGNAQADIANPDYALASTLQFPGSTHWDYLTFDTSTHRLFITRSDSIDILDTDSKKVIGTIPDLNGVHGVALASDLNEGFVTEGKSNRVTIFDLTDFGIMGTVPTGKKPDAIVYDKATQRVFAADGESEDLTVINAKTDIVIGTIKLDGRPEFAVVDGKGRLYINLEDKSQIVVVDTRKMKTIAHYNLAPGCESPTGLAIDQERARLFSTCAQNMLVVDAGTGKIIDTLPIGSHSDAAAFDEEKDLAFSSNGDGTLTIVGVGNDGHYKVMQTVKTQVTARTMALDPLTHAIYMAAAETAGFDQPTEKESQTPSARRP